MLSCPPCGFVVTLMCIPVKTKNFNKRDPGVSHRVGTSVAFLSCTKPRGTSLNKQSPNSWRTKRSPRFTGVTNMFKRGPESKKRSTQCRDFETLCGRSHVHTAFCIQR